MNPSSDIDAAVRDVLDQHGGIRLALLFGSMAAGEGGPNSDVDLAVAGERSLTGAERLQLSERLGELLGRPIDLVDLRAAGPVVSSEIFRHGRRLLGSEADLTGWISRSLVDREDFLPALQDLLQERRRAWIG